MLVIVLYRMLSIIIILVIISKGVFVDIWIVNDFILEFYFLLIVLSWVF